MQFQVLLVLGDIVKEKPESTVPEYCVQAHVNILAEARESFVGKKLRQS